MKKPKPRNVTSRARWMPCPTISSEYPGLAFMSPLEELIVVKQTDALHDVIGGDGTGYTIFNSQGQKVFLAVEKRKCKKFDIKIFNRYGNEVIQVKRPLRACLNKAKVWAPPGNLVGVVNEINSCVNTFLVHDWYGIALYKIKAEGLFSIVYNIMFNNTKLGKITNNWPMDMTDICKVKHFGVSFPEGMHVLNKAVLVGALFLIACLQY